MSTIETEGPGKAKSPRQRSPNYPSMDLKALVDKLPVVFEKMKRHAVGVELAVGYLGYSYSSSTGKLALASMRAFGLFENETPATVKLSSRALDMIDFPKESPEWWRAAKAASLAPKVHAQLWGKWGSSLPPEDEMKRHLVRDLKFNDNAVGSFIEEYKATIGFAKLSPDDKIDASIGETDDGETGDNGSLASSPPPPLKKRREMLPGTKEDVFSLDEGAVILQWPERLSKASAEDLHDWLELIGRKIKRAASAPPPDDQDDD